MSKLIHKNCGGEVKNKICLKCQKSWGALGYLFTTEVQKVESEENFRFDKEEYKKRIREGKDIYK